MIIRLIEAYPEFKPMYEEAYRLCRNIEEVMGMFSKELAELDRNTVQLMIDDMQDEIRDKDREISSQKQEIDNQKQQLAQAKEKRGSMIRRVYQSLQDLEETARMLGIPLQEAEDAMKEGAAVLSLCSLLYFFIGKTLF